jgi:catecholate siderophore receptor
VHRFADRSEWRTTLRAGAYTRDQRASAIRIAPPRTARRGRSHAGELRPRTVLRRSGGNGTSAKIQDLDAVTLQSDYDTRFQAWGLRHAVQAGVDVAQTTGSPASRPPTRPAARCSSPTSPRRRWVAAAGSTSRFA